MLFILRIDRTYKLYVGGKQKRPDANYSRNVLNSKGEVIGQVGDGNRKDIRDAVEAAFAGQAGYEVIYDDILCDIDVKFWYLSCSIRNWFVPQIQKAVSYTRNYSVHLFR